MKISSLLIGVLALGMFLGGCSRTNERNRSVVEVVSVAEAGVHLAAMLDAGGDNDICDPDDNFIPLGHVPITLHNRPYNSFNNANELTPYGIFNVTEITVQWTNVFAEDPSEATNHYNELQNYNFTSNYNISVPIGDVVVFNALVVPAYLKTSLYFSDLIPVCAGGGGVMDPFAATALLTLAGHESGSEEIVYIQAAVLVEFVGFSS